MKYKNLLQALQEADCSGVVITDPINLRYITGCDNLEGILCVTTEHMILFIDDRYAGLDIPESIYKVHGDQEYIERAFLQKLASIQGNIGFDDSIISVRLYTKMRKVTPNIVPVPYFFARLRRKKTAQEITAIEHACSLCSQGLCYLMQFLQEGISEKELVQKVKTFWLSHGADDVSFAPIIAFGKNAACPHWSSSSNALRKGQVVLIDLGVQKDGYHSDMTRTIFFGTPDPELHRYFSYVKKAYTLAVQSAKPGILPSQLDKLVRDFFTSMNCNQYYTHALGHGVGLQVHEPPRLSSTRLDQDPLQQGDVITLEPGLYVPDKGGIRLEDTFVVESAGVRSLTSVGCPI